MQKIKRKIRYLSIRSRHPSCDGLRSKIKLNNLAVYRHGSTSESSIKREINSPEAVKISSCKLLMKQAFDKHEVKTPKWFKLSEAQANETCVKNKNISLEYPVVIKNLYGSRGRGNYKIDNLKAFNEVIKNKNLNNYIVEAFFSGSREYRVHITDFGPIYCLRKMLKNDIPKEKRWVRNDETCSWIMEHQAILGKNDEFLGFNSQDSEQFDKPVNWNAIIEQCKKTLNAVGLDIGAVDLKVQSKADKKGIKRDNPEFVIIEINSAPSLGRITTEVYKQNLPKILQKKYGNN